MDPRSKVEAQRKRERHQAALDLREVLRTDAGKRFYARLLHRAGTYDDAPNKLARGKRQLGLALERDVLRASGEKMLAELRHIIFTRIIPELTAEVVPHAGDSSDL